MTIFFFKKKDNLSAVETEQAYTLNTLLLSPLQRMQVCYVTKKKV